jgi:hypothetical protein
METAQLKQNKRLANTALRMDSHTKIKGERAVEFD